MELKVIAERVRRRNRLLCIFEKVKKASWGRCLKRDKELREIEKSTDEAFRMVIQGIGGSTAAVHNHPWHHKNGVRIKGTGSRALHVFFWLTLRVTMKMWIPSYRWGHWVRKLTCWNQVLSVLPSGPPRSGGARVWIHICLTSKSMLFLVFHIAQWSHCQFKLLRRGMDVKSHLLIPQTFSRYHVSCLFHYPTPLLQLLCYRHPLCSYLI